MRWAAWLVLGWLGAVAEAALPPPAEGTAVVCDQPPRIDGIADEPLWRRAPVLPLRWRFLTQTGVPDQPTIARCAWDRNALYVLFAADDRDVWSTITERDGPLWDGEVLEVYLDPDGDGLGYFEFEVSPLGTEIDLRIDDPARMADVPRYKLWNAAGWRSAAGVRGTVANRFDTDSGWTVEMAIPFAALGRPAPRDSEVWRAQFFRIDRPLTGEPEFSAWSPTTNFHVPTCFGRLRFVGPTGVVAAAADAPRVLWQSSFEAGLAGAVARDAARLEAGAAEGRWSVRLDDRGRLQLPWLGESGRGTVSLDLRGEVDEARATVAMIPLEGEPVTAEFRLTRGWRRYAVPFDLVGPARCEVHAAGDEAVRLDAVVIELGDATVFVPRPEVGVRVADGRRLRRAGESVRFDTTVRLPGGGRTELVWRLEDGFGQLLRRGTESISTHRGEPGTVSVRLGHLDRGAYRWTAEIEIDGEHHRDDATLACASWELGEPDPWFGVRGAAGEAGRGAMELLRCGLLAGVTWPGDDQPLPGDLERELIACRRAGLTVWGLLPEPGPDYAARCAARARAGRGRFAGWEVPAGAAPTEVRAAREGLDRVDSGLRLVAEDSAVERVQPAVRWDLLAAAPDLAGRVVLAGPLPASAWDADPRVPASAALAPLEQARALARGILLARAAGATAFVYHGAPRGRNPATLTLAGEPVGDLYDAQGTPLPAVAALDWVLDSIRDRRLAERLEPAPGMVCLRWSGRRPLATAWSETGDVLEWTLDLPAERLEVRDLLGRRRLPPRATAALRVGGEPVYIETDLDYRRFAAAVREGRATVVEQAASR